MKSGTGLVRDISPRGRVNPGDEGPRDRASGKEEEPRIKPDPRKQQASSHLSALSCRGWVPTVPPSPTPSPGTFYRPGSCSGDTESAGCRLGVRGALESPCGSPSACACWLTPGNRHLPLLGGGGAWGHWTAEPLARCLASHAQHSPASVPTERPLPQAGTASQHVSSPCCSAGRLG